MQLKKILKSAFKIKNLALLAGVAIVSYLTGYLPFTLVGAAGYVYFVLQTLKDDMFIKENSEEEKIDSIRKLSEQCNDLYHQARKFVERQYIEKIENILQDRDELMDLFGKDRDDYIKQKVVEQAIQLVMAYINLISGYSQIRKELTTIDTNEAMDRINTTERKIRFLKDSQAIEDMKHAIEIDRELLEKVDQRKKELERTAAKLTFIESTLKTFKHQIITRESTDETVSEIENIINEATALNNVLDEDRKDKLRL